MDDVETAATPVDRNAIFKPPSEMASEELRQLTESIVTALKTVYDQEIYADIYELGLILNLDIEENRFLTFRMTVTAPCFPGAGGMPAWVENPVGSLSGGPRANVNM